MPATTTVSFPDMEDIPTDVLLEETPVTSAKSEPPVMDDVPDLFVNLPRGVWKDGVWERQAEVKELTGVEEEFISKYTTRTESFDAVLSVGVVRIGSIDLASKPHADRLEVLDQLLVGERHALYIAVTRVTFGNEKEFSYTCECLSEVETSVDMAKDLQLVSPDKDLTTGLFEYKSTFSNLDVEFRLLTGSDEKEILERKTSTVPEQVSIALQNAVKKVNGGPVLDPRSFVRNMKSRDRKGLMEVIDSYQPKVDMDVEIECPACGRKTKFALSWSDLFL